MARTKQTARKSSGGKAPRKQLASKASRGFKSWMTSQQTSGTNEKVVFVNHDNTFPQFAFDVPESKDGAEFTPCLAAGATAPVPELQAAAESFLGVTFASKLHGAGMAAFELPPVCLTIVLDVSGSMSSAFDSAGNGWGRAPRDSSKLGVALRCVRAIAMQLQPHDTLSLVTFENIQQVVIPPTRVSELTPDGLDATLDALGARGGTDLSGGLSVGIAQTVAAVQGCRREAGANTPVVGRTMFLTDMESHQGDQDQVIQAVHDAACKARVPTHTTLVGVGVDVSRATVNRILAVPGAVYMSVASAEEFEASIAGEFKYDVLPLAFNVTISSPDRSFVINNGYGSSELALVQPGSDKAVLSSEFASPRDRGTGLVSGALRLFKIVPTSKASVTPDGGKGVRVAVTWEDRLGKKHSMQQEVTIPAVREAGGSFTSNNVRKGVALVRYVDVLTTYCLDDNADEGSTGGRDAIQRLQAPRRRAAAGAGFGAGAGGAHAARAAPVATGIAKARLASHERYAASFKFLRRWLETELAACGDTSVFSAAGTNQATAQTIDQVIGFEEADVKKYRELVSRVSYRAKLRSHSPAGGKTGGAGGVASFQCPITCEVMRDPVLAADGHTYERDAITKWLVDNNTSPLTGSPLEHKALVPNHALRGAIDEYRAAQAGAAAFRAPNNPFAGPRGRRTLQSARRTAQSGGPLLPAPATPAPAAPPAGGTATATATATRRSRRRGRSPTAPTAASKATRKAPTKRRRR